jgi:leucyl-tRNA---protein transferase
VLDDGLSMVYSFYDPALAKESLGTYVILDHVEIAREAGLPYVYLGYWVPGSPKMGYKAKFPALEVYAGGAWRALGNPATYSSDTTPCRPIRSPSRSPGSACPTPRCEVRRLWVRTGR